MTPYSHAYCGLAAGYLLAPALEQLGVRRRLTVWTTTLGALAPDVDAIWLFINKANYTSKAWYGHHGATHSLVGAVLLGCLVGAGLWLMALVLKRIIRPPESDRLDHAANNAQGFQPARSRPWLGFLALLVAGSLGALLHLPGDLVTLSGVWGGLPLTWPWNMERTPALGLVPWRDYFVILVALLSFVALPCLAFIERWLPRRHLLCWPAALFSIVLVVGYLQSLPPYSNAALWHEQQRQTVGPTLYQLARKVETRYVWPLFR